MRAFEFQMNLKVGFSGVVEPRESSTKKYLQVYLYMYHWTITLASIILIPAENHNMFKQDKKEGHLCVWDLSR